MRESNAIGKAWHLLKRQGVSSVVQAAARKFYDRHRSIWFARPLDDSLEVITPRFEGRMDFDHPDRVLDFINERNLPGMNDSVEIASMKKRGHIFAGVMNGERMIGFIKLGWESVYVLDYELDIRVNPGDFFVIDIFIGPENRGLGAGPFLVSASSLEMKRRGFTRGVMHVRTDKTPMLRTCARTGYHEIGRVDYRSILGKKILRPHPMELIAASGGATHGESS